jgi:hypothetical protein
MRKVWAVSRGEYSDYYVAGLFETESLAQEVAGLRDDARVEEFFLWEEKPPVVSELELDVDLKAGKPTPAVRERIINHVGYDGMVPVAPDSDGYVYVTQPSQNIFSGAVWNGSVSVLEHGTDFQRVRKAFNEKLMQAKVAVEQMEVFPEPPTITMTTN